ncbi:sulfopyruvate decarboxylase subunit beta [Microbacterium pseudoresistens]|uniref:Thiamine pyrophosphate-dependent acetolactate synthase large subunit-like protein n=1 Tax=Microbacterium pseudoresistens TaxID=640634 RepID=A0A7Y9EV24_9MICO|nr:thiamine pyrophosphate-dependent enzyme [Microbacterium pseudoresistens]NYD54371.1 thiamine pyrophosphate-dependent acetolactate synthase large subunit-like protein [Microbacterium pseudoresistens]
MMRRIDALEVLAPRLRNNPVVVTCAATSRELAHVQDSDNHLYLLDSMGLVGSVAAGLALALGDGGEKVIAIEGDGSLLMNPNVLFTDAALKPENLVIVLLDNGVFGSTGNLPTYAGNIDLGAAAEALGHEVRRAQDADTLLAGLEELLSVDGPSLLHVRTEVGNAEVDKLLVDPVDIKTRFTSWLTGARIEGADDVR